MAFMGDTKGGAFDISGNVAERLLGMPNPDGRSNADVVRPWVNGLDVTRRPRRMWIIDFGTDMPLQEAALYEGPFEHVRERVKPQRDESRSTRSQWWLHERPRVDMRNALSASVAFHRHAERNQASLVVGGCRQAPLPDHTAHRLRPRRRLLLRRAALHAARSLGLGPGHAARNAASLHPDRRPSKTFPSRAEPAEAAVHRRRRRRQAARRAPPRVARPAGRATGGARQAHAHQPLQTAPRPWLDPRSPAPRPAPSTTPTAGRYPLDDDDVLERLLELNQARSRPANESRG